MQSLGHQFRPVDAAVGYGGGTFTFRLLRETLEVAEGREVDYFSMHGGRLRARGGGVNFIPVMDFWWATRREASGSDDDPADLFTGVMAETYRLFTTSRALQDVYADAYGSKLIDREFSLPEYESVRLKKLGHEAGAGAVRRELEHLFLGKLPEPVVLGRCAEAAHRWVVNGAAALRAGGVAGLRRWVDGELAPWVRRFRKRGGNGGGGGAAARTFLNLFSHEAKAQFHRCVANAWVGIVPWLREHAELDLAGERLICFMNALNRPGLDEDGDGDGNGNGNGNGDGDREVVAACADAGVRRGTLCGELLSLHPVSRYVLAQDGLRQVLGKWLLHPDYESLTAAGPAAVGACPEYRNAVTAILIAAHEYDRNQDDYEKRRGKRTVSGDGNINCGPNGGDNRDSLLANTARDDASATSASLFGDFAAGNGIRCPECGGAALFLEHGQQSDEDGDVEVSFRCRGDERHGAFRKIVAFEELNAWVAGGGSRRDAA
jgi:hypothetical protein